MIASNRLIVGLCSLVLIPVSGCSSTELAGSYAQVVAPFEAPTSAPSPEMDEPIERFVARWNAWVDTVPEDQRVGDAIEQAGERIRDKIVQFPLTPEGYDG